MRPATWSTRSQTLRSKVANGEASTFDASLAMARALEEMRRQPGCSGVTSIAINRVDGSDRHPAKSDQKTSPASCAVANPPAPGPTDLQGAVQPPLQKYFRFPSEPKSPYIPRRPVPLEGRFAIVTDAGRDAVDAEALLTKALICGRRSRVVLTPRRWRQVPGKQASRGRRWQESPVTGESAK